MAAPVLLTVATGYIGGRLLRHFEEAGRPVRCLARNPERVKATRSTTEVVQADCLDEAALGRALAGVDSAYWYVLLPAHEGMFSGLLHEIARRATLPGIGLNREATECPTIGS